MKRNAGDKLRLIAIHKFVDNQIKQQITSDDGKYLKYIIVCICMYVYN